MHWKVKSSIAGRALYSKKLKMCATFLFILSNEVLYFTEGKYNTEPSRGKQTTAGEKEKMHATLGICVWDF
jgi:hypothetical protein